MLRTLVLCALAAAPGMGCAPTLFFNRSFLTAEELKLNKDGYASLKSTGETFDLGPIKALEAAAGDRVLVLEVHGTYLLVGDNFKRVWRLWHGGTDKAKFEALDKPLSGIPGGGFSSPTLEPSGKCALMKWKKGTQEGQAFINADGDVDEKKCPE